MNIPNIKTNIQKKKIKELSIFLLLYSIMPIIDTLNGFFLLQLRVDFSIGQIYRLILIILILRITLSKKCKKKFLYSALFIITAFCILSLFHIFNSGMVKDEISLMIQWLLIPIFLFGFYELKRRNELSVFSIDRIFNTYSWLVPLTIIIPKVLGLGFNTYGGEVGYKGFYYANNGLSYLIAILIIYSFYKLFNDRLSISIVIQISILIAATLMIGTKSSLFSILIGIVIASIICFRSGKLKAYITVFIILFILILFFYFFKEELIIKMNDIINRYYYISSIYNDSFLNSITAGRLSKFNQLLCIMKNASDYPLNILYGLGYSEIVAEMDFIDLFFSYGIFGIILLLYYMGVFVKQIQFNYTIFKILIIFSLIYSCIVGHVFNNSMSSMVLVLIFACGKLK